MTTLTEKEGRIFNLLTEKRTTNTSFSNKENKVFELLTEKTRFEEPTIPIPEEKGLIQRGIEMLPPDTFLPIHGALKARETIEGLEAKDFKIGATVGGIGGALVGGKAAGVRGAIIGGGLGAGLGESVEQMIRRGLGLEVPETPLEAAKDIGIQTGIGLGAEAGARFALPIIGKILAPFKKAVSTDAERVIQFFKNKTRTGAFGQKISPLFPAQATGITEGSGAAGLLDFMHNIADNSIIGSSGMRRISKQNVDVVAEVIDDLLNTMNKQNVTANQLGVTLDAVLRGNLKIERTASEALYNSIDDALKGKFVLRRAFKTTTIPTTTRTFEQQVVDSVNLIAKRIKATRLVPTPTGMPKTSQAEIISAVNLLAKKTKLGVPLSQTTLAVPEVTALKTIRESILPQQLKGEILDLVNLSAKKIPLTRKVTERVGVRKVVSEVLDPRTLTQAKEKVGIVNTGEIKGFARDVQKLSDELRGFGAEEQGFNTVKQVLQFNDNLSFNAAKNARTSLLNMARNRSLEGKADPAIGLARKLASQVDGAIEKALKKHAPKQLKLWRKANRAYKATNEQFDNRLIREIFDMVNRKKGGNPEDVIRTVFKPGAITNVKRIKRAVDPRTWGEIKRFHTENLLKQSSLGAEELAAGGLQRGTTITDLGAGGRLLDGAKFKQNLFGLGNEMLNTIYTTKELVTLKAVARQMDLSQRTVGQGLGRMFIQLSQAGAIIGVLSGRAAGLGIPLIIGPGILSRVFTNPVTAKLLIQGYKLPAGSPQLASILARLSASVVEMEAKEAKRKIIEASPRLRIRTQ